MKKTDNIKIIANPYLFWGWIVEIVVISSMVLFMCVSFSTIWKEQSPHYQGQIFFGGGELIVLALLCIISDRWAVFVTLTEKTLIFKAGFKKPVEQEYDKYRYIYRASYWHGSLVGWGYQPQYFVLSRRRMTTEELQNINQVAPSEKVVKIRYSKRMHRRLAAVLPTYFRIELDRLFPEGKIASHDLKSEP